MDTDLFRQVNDLAADTSWLHGFATFYAGFLGPALLAALVLLACWTARGREARALAVAVWAGLAPLAAVALNQPIVHAADRMRPYNALDHVLVLVHRSADASFPSDHSVLAGSVIAALFLFDRRFGWAAVAAGGLLAFFRVYVGAHYPGDVVAGLAVGAVISLLGWLLLQRPLTAGVELLRRQAVLAPLLTAGAHRS